MSKRPLTPEEKQLWRESNRFTKKKAGLIEEPLEETAPSAAANSLPAARAGIVAKPAAKQSVIPLPLLSRREANKRSAPHPHVEATLDLHGYTKLEAHAKVESFVIRQHVAGRRHVTIITGKGSRGGEGILRSHVPDWLNEARLRPIIAGMFHAAERDGGSGVLHVLLKKH